MLRLAAVASVISEQQIDIAHFCGSVPESVLVEACCERNASSQALLTPQAVDWCEPHACMRACIHVCMRVYACVYVHLLGAATNSSDLCVRLPSPSTPLQPSHLTPSNPHTSHLHPSHLTPRTSHLAPHTSHLAPHTSHLTPHPPPRPHPSPSSPTLTSHLHPRPRP